MRASDAARLKAAPLLERAGAYLVDSLITALIWAAIALSLTGGTIDATQWAPATGQVVSMAFLVVPFAYFVTLEGIWATTPGKLVFGLSVTRADGDPAGWYRATVRNVLRLAWSLGPAGPVFLALDAMLVQWTERDVRLGDHAAGTRVVRGRRALAPGLTGR